MPSPSVRSLSRCLLRVIAIAVTCVPLAHAQQTLETRSINVGQSSKRLALVIGNDDYQKVSKLEKAGNDASAMARELKTAGFDVQLHRDLNYHAMVKAVEAFSNRVNGGDVVVVFFAGHGVQIKTGGYLLPVDIEATSESQVERTAYGLADLTDKLSEARASFALVMVDACRDNPLKSKGRAIGNTRGLSAIEPPKGQMVVYSASKGQQALDRLSDTDNNPNSVFTRTFIGHMKKPGVRIEEMMREVQDAVEDLAQSVSHEQRPAIYNESRGNFYFVGPAIMQELPLGQTQVTPPAVTSVSPAPTTRVHVAGTDTESEFWNEVKASGAREYLNAYLKQYPKGRYVALARVHLKKLDDKERTERARNEGAKKQAAEREQQEAKHIEQAAWDAAKTDNSAAAYASYLERYPKGSHVALAQAGRKKLMTDGTKAGVGAKPGSGFKDCADCPEMVVVPAGSFEMGSPASESGRSDDEGPRHRVTVRSFAAGKFEVTRGQFATFVSASGHSASNDCYTFESGNLESRSGRNWQNPGFTQSDDHPVVCVNWDDAKAYVAWLSRRTGKTYRLLTEAEWEYAARAGTSTARYWGESSDEACDYANVMDATGKNQVARVTWERHNCTDGQDRTAPAGRFKPNTFGLYDMIGNAWEWTEDCWNKNYNGAPTDGSAWTSGECSVGRVLRGGSWVDEPLLARSASRGKGNAAVRSNYDGFRAARTLP